MGWATMKRIRYLTYKLIKWFVNDKGSAETFEAYTKGYIGIASFSLVVDYWAVILLFKKYVQFIIV